MAELVAAVRAELAAYFGGPQVHANGPSDVYDRLAEPDAGTGSGA